MTFDSWLQSNLFGQERLSSHLPVFFALCAGYGLWRFTSIASSCVGFIWRHTCRREQDLYELYGATKTPLKRSWAVVTGGSDGYGLDICNKLAAKGFNICIVARNEAKMQEKLAEIKKVAPLVQTKCVVADFFEMLTIKQYQETIADKLKDIDVALLILNAGVGQVGPFSEAPAERLQHVMSINALHPMYTAKVMINQLLERKERSAIVVVSSGLGGRPIPGCVTYSSAKACSSFMAQALSYEVRDKIDVMSYEAGPAGTKMFPVEKRAKMQPVGPSVDAMLRDLGRETKTNGGFKHDWQQCLF